jgi:hypothetical protein
MVGKVTSLTIRIHNHTDRPQEFSLTVSDPTSAFLFSGEKQSSFFVQPHSAHLLKHNLIPLYPGRQQLPHFMVISKRIGKELLQTKQQRFLFVNPSQEPVKHFQ